jgi:hypothetical protein
MTGLPPLLLRVPKMLYAAAVLFFLASFGLTLIEVDSSFAYAEAGNPLIRQLLLRGLYQAALEALYIATNGVLAHILLAIWQNGRSQSVRGDAE